MNDTVRSIAAASPSIPSMDYARLRDEGIAHLVDLARNVWTDHNSHDPGITILEVLCYAITELGYRTSLPIEDLLARPDQETRDPVRSRFGLFEADEALSGNPLTAEDYRKIVIDTPGVANAFVKPLWRDLSPRAMTIRGDLVDDQPEFPWQVHPGVEPDLEATPSPSSTGIAEDELSRRPECMYEIYLEFEDRDLNLASEYISTAPAGVGAMMIGGELTTSGVPPFQVGDSVSIEISLPVWDEVHKRLFDVGIADENDSVGIGHLTIAGDRNKVLEFPFVVGNGDQGWRGMTVGSDDGATDPMDAFRVRAGDEIEVELPTGTLFSEDWFFQYAGDEESGDVTNFKVTSIVSRHLHGRFDASSGIADQDTLSKSGMTIELPDGHATEHPFWLRPEDPLDQILRAGEDDFVAYVDVTFGDGLIIRHLNVNVRVIVPTDGVERRLRSIAEFLNGAQAKAEFVRFRKNLARIGESLRQIRTKVQASRNLCEDFVPFKAVGVHELGLDARVAISPEADARTVLGEIYRDVNGFLSQPVEFSTREELLGQDVPTESVFDGPLLESGFLTDDSIAVDRRRDVVFTSELIAVMMSVEGVETVEIERIRHYVDSEEYISQSDDRVMLSQSAAERADDHPGEFQRAEFKVRLSSLPKRTGWEFERQRKNAPATPIRITDTDVRLLAERAKPVRRLTTKRALDIPTGRYLDLARYDSIQRDFPAVYGIALQDLADENTPNLSLKRRQLKGYLLLFEQHLANYFAQLEHVKSLFCLEPAAETYAVQLPRDIPGFESLFEAESPELAESTFTAQRYFAQLQSDSRIIEQDREQRLLDHMLAIYGESIGDKTLQDLDAVRTHDLTRAKRTLLPQVAAIGHDRSKGRNLRPKSYFVGGKRDGFRLNVTDEQGDVLLTSSQTQSSLAATRRIYERVSCRGIDYDNFVIKQEPDERYSIQLLSESKESTIADAGVHFPEQSEAEHEIDRIVWHLRRHSPFSGLERKVAILLGIPLRTERLLHQGGEGFYMVEHLPLRQGLYVNNRALIDGLSGRADCGDPFLHRITFVFPGDKVKGRNSEVEDHIRSHIRQVVRHETPPHIVADIVFAERETLKPFERSLWNWLAVLDTPQTNYGLRPRAQLQFVEALVAVRNAESKRPLQ